MASLIPTEIANLLANALQGQLVSGTLRRETVSALNELGDPLTTTISTHSVQGIRENFRTDFQTINSIPMTDVKILLIMNLIKPATTPIKDDLINIYGEWYRVRAVLEIDPARATASLQCFRTEAPS